MLLILIYFECFAGFPGRALLVRVIREAIDHEVTTRKHHIYGLSWSEGHTTRLVLVDS